MATTPPNNYVAIFDDQGSQEATTKAEDKIIGWLRDDNYIIIDDWRDPSDGTDFHNHHGITLLNFVRMAGKGIVIINGHGGGSKGVVGEEWSYNAAGAIALNVTMYDYIHIYGWDPSWLSTGQGLTGRGGRQLALILTPLGIDHFFKGKDTGLIFSDGCGSSATAGDFHARAFFSYTGETSCTKEAAGGDMEKFFSRLAGFEGTTLRTTQAAWGGGKGYSAGTKLIGANLVLTPAVESADPCASMSVCDSTGGLVTAGGGTAGSVQFDAAMDTSPSNTTGVITASGCGGGASVSNEAWNQDGTVLTFQVNLPASASAGTLTLKVNNELAVADPGGFSNDPLDGNASGDSGVAPNRNDFVWQVPCAPVPTACNLLTSAQAQQWFGAADVDDDPVECFPVIDTPEQGTWSVQVTAAQQQMGEGGGAMELDVHNTYPAGYLANEGAVAWGHSVACPTTPQVVSGVGQAAYYCSPYNSNRTCSFTAFSAQQGTDEIDEQDSCIGPQPSEASEAPLMNVMLANLASG
ncbi:MAG: hypothetical protein ACLP01_26270 [Solirubrobacteraceae bacterium]